VPQEFVSVAQLIFESVEDCSGIGHGGRVFGRKRLCDCSRLWTSFVVGIKIPRAGVNDSSYVVEKLVCATQ
jgi:hypothetical protein